MLDELFKRFVKEKTFLANVSPKTVRFYQQSYKAFKRTVQGERILTIENFKEIALIPSSFQTFRFDSHF